MLIVLMYSKLRITHKLVSHRNRKQTNSAIIRLVVKKDKKLILKCVKHIYTEELYHYSYVIELQHKLDTSLLK